MALLGRESISFNQTEEFNLYLSFFLPDVMIVNRHNYFDRLKNFDVRVGVNKDNLQNPTCHDRVRTVGQGQALRVQCDPPIPGRYVSVQMFGEGILTMCEVTVYSRVGKCKNERTKNTINWHATQQSAYFKTLSHLARGRLSHTRYALRFPQGQFTPLTHVK